MCVKLSSHLLYQYLYKKLIVFVFCPLTPFNKNCAINNLSNCFLEIRNYILSHGDYSGTADQECIQAKQVHEQITTATIHLSKAEKNLVSKIFFLVKFEEKHTCTKY